MGAVGLPCREVYLLLFVRCFGYDALVPKGMELDNSKVKRKTAPDSTAVFFAPAPDSFLAGRATAIQHPQGENRPLSFT
jgi:hypothetical protein